MSPQTIQKNKTVMKKNISKLFLLSFFCCLVACSGNNGEAYYHQWEGEYVAKQTMEVVYSDGTTESYEFESSEIPLYIFQDEDLYVQTYGIGDPFNPEVDSEEHALLVKSPKQASLMSIVLRNGGVYTYYNGNVYSPNPILVSKAKSDQLILSNGVPFEAAATDAAGNQIDVYECHWEYAPIQKYDEVYTWGAELHTQSKYRSGESVVPIIMRHNFVIKRK